MTISAQASARNLERMTIGGNEYIRLAEWAATEGCSMRWNKSDGEIDVSGTPARLNFSIDSRRAEIFGVSVWLCLPVINRNGVPMIALADARSTIEPVIAPRKSESHVRTICLDPGHGGKDAGKAQGSNYEKKYTLLLARETAELLKEQGFKVVMTRTEDEAVELSDRPQAATRHGADLFVSLHYNAAEAPLHGVEVFCLAPPGMNSSDEGGGTASHPSEAGNAQDDRNVLLAYEMQKSITRSLPLEDLGLKRSHFEVLRLARVPAILVEGGFLSSPSDAKTIYDAAFRKRMARAIVEGINAYKRAATKP
ncbi:MAG TPA: N-acetylmuramoyl-L-alanine amidase [Verrucomicrobiae bacterium]